MNFPSLSVFEDESHYKSQELLKLAKVYPGFQSKLDEIQAPSSRLGAKGEGGARKGPWPPRKKGHWLRPEKAVDSADFWENSNKYLTRKKKTSNKFSLRDKSKGFIWASTPFHIKNFSQHLILANCIIRITEPLYKIILTKIKTWPMEKVLHFIRKGSSKPNLPDDT